MGRLVLTGGLKGTVMDVDRSGYETLHDGGGGGGERAGEEMKASGCGEGPENVMGFLEAFHRRAVLLMQS